MAVASGPAGPVLAGPLFDESSVIIHDLSARVIYCVYICARKCDRDQPHRSCYGSEHRSGIFAKN